MIFQNILIIKMSAIGDVIHALPVAHALKSQFPEARITWMVEQSAFELLTNNPCIDNILLFDKPQYKSVKGIIEHAPKLARQLGDLKFDLALDLQGLFKSAAVSVLSGAKLRLGYCNMREGSGLISRPVCGFHKDGHVVERYLDVARAVGCQVVKPTFSIMVTDEEAEKARMIAEQSELVLDKPYLIFAPGTNWLTKRWPTAHYAQLADRIAETIKCQLVVIGGPGDSQLAREITCKTKAPLINLTGKTSLKQLAYLLRNAQIFIGSDSGPMHLAVAVDTPVVTIFGPTDPNRNGPYQGNNLVLTVNRDCVRCQKRNCNQNCLGAVTVDQVYEGVRGILSNPKEILL